MDNATGPGTGSERVEPRPVVAVPGRVLTVEDVAAFNRATTVAQMLPGVAHDLNNALQVVAGLVEMLAARGQLTPEALDKVTRIGGQASRAIGLVREFVAFAKRDQGGIRPVDVARVVEHVLAFRRYHIGRARIAVELRGVEPGRHIVRTDGQYLTQVLLNLVINAEHALVGAAAPLIVVEVQDLEGDVEVSVTDNGQGLADGATARAAAPFYTTKGSAVGLGLTAAEALASSLGGRLGIGSGAEGGTRVAITLPGRALCLPLDEGPGTLP